MAELNSAVLQERLEHLNASTLPYTMKDVDTVIRNWLREWWDAEIVEQFLEEVDSPSLPLDE